MKLKRPAVLEQTANDACRRGVDIGKTALGGRVDPGLRMPATDRLPRCLTLSVVTAEAQPFLGEHEPVRGPVGQREGVLVNPVRRRQADVRLHARRHLVAHKKLVVGTALQGDELFEVLRPEHPTQHLEEPDDVGLARPVGSDEHGGVTEIGQFHIGERPKAADRHRFKAGPRLGRSFPRALRDLAGQVSLSMSLTP